VSDKTKPMILLEHYLKKLKLPTLLREYQPLAVVCREERADYPTYLLRLTERELLDRERRAAERRIKEAGFPVVKTLDTFTFKAQPSINEALVRELLRGEYIDKKENVLLRSATAVLAKRTWPVPWPLPPVPRDAVCAFIRSPGWSPNFWNVGRKESFNACIGSWLACS